MNDDPDFDGASLLIVGSHVLDAGAERPALGLSLGRERSTGRSTWFIGTRMAREPARETSDVRFEGGAPPLSALARRIEVGEFGHWFGALKADADAGRVHPIRSGARARVEHGPIAAVPARAESAGVHRIAFPSAPDVPAIRARSGHR